MEKSNRAGIPNWYEWSIKYWGTKWNSYSFQQTDWNIFTFETAWSTPKPILKKLIELHPDVMFIITYADEDIGSNCGIFIGKHGKITDHFTPTHGSPEALELGEIWNSNNEDED